MPYEITRIVYQAAQEQSPWVAGGIGVLGAVAGSVTTILWTEHFNRRQARERSNALAFSVMTKIEEMYSTLSAIRKGFQNAREELDKEKSEYQSAPPKIVDGKLVIQKFFLHTYIQSSANSFPEREINGDELWAVNRVGGGNLLSKVAPLSRRYNTVVNSFRVYSERREEPDDLFKVTGADGVTATMEIDPNNPRQMLKLNSIEKMAIDIEGLTHDATREAYEALVGIIHAYRRPLGKKAKLIMSDLDGVERTFSAQDAPVFREEWWQFWRKRYDDEAAEIKV